MASPKALAPDSPPGPGRPSSTKSQDQAPELLTAFVLLVFTVVNLLLGCVTLVFSCLRETPDFWLNKGGYPILLREIVLIGYYPLLLLDLCLLIALTIVPCAKLKVPRSFLVVEICLLSACWLVFFACVGVSAKNNLINYWNDRPIHYKSSSTSR